MIRSTGAWQHPGESRAASLASEQSVWSRVTWTDAPINGRPFRFYRKNSSDSGLGRRPELKSEEFIYKTQ